MTRLKTFGLAALAVTVAACSEADMQLLAPETMTPRFSTGSTVTPRTVSDKNPTCAIAGYGSGYFASKYEYSSVTGFTFASGFAAGVNVFQMTRTSTGHYTFQTNANSGVLVSGNIGKGGNQGAYIFDYNPPVASGSGYVPLNSSGPQAEISHVELCFRYQLQVSATATPTFDRTYAWSINKTADQASLTLAQGQAQPVAVNYTVSVASNSGTDSNWKASGTVSVKNPAHVNAAVNIVAPAGVTLSCTLPQTVAAGATLSCGYTASLASGASGSFTFQATTTTSGVLNNSATASYSFVTPTTLIDNCVNVTDSMKGSLGSKCVGATSFAFPYSISFAASSYTCGTHQANNTATFTTNTSAATGSKTHTLAVTLTCASVASVCTLSQGYWKNHGDPATKRYDARWANVGGRNASFFNHAGHTWISIWNTPPAGNAYYSLAHQYMAAKLNILGGATNAPAAVLAAVAAAEAFFAANAPGAKLSGTAKTNAQNWATALEAFNAKPPFHCSE